MRVVLISPEHPPAGAGVADHTRGLARALVAAGHEPTVVTVRRDRPPVEDDGVTVTPAAPGCEAAPDMEALAAAARDAAPDVVVLQYLPHLWGRRGVNPHLGDLARRAAEAAPLVVLCHELWMPWGTNPLRWPAAAAHRRQLRQVLAPASRVGVSTARWLEDVRGAAPDGADCRVVPSPATIRPVPEGATAPPDAQAIAAARERHAPGDALLAVHLGQHHPGHVRRWMLRAVAPHAPGGDAGPEVRLVDIGERPAAMETPPGVTSVGRLPAEEVGALLHAADIGLFPYADGVSTRRTAFMSALAHGLACVTTRGPSTDPVAFTPDEDPPPALMAPVQECPPAFAAAFERLVADPDLRAAVGRAGRAAHDERFDWPQVLPLVTDPVT